MSPSLPSSLRRPVDSLAQEERVALAALLDEVGPDAPTLCAGWRTRDLAAHLVTREAQPLAGPGLVLGGPAGRVTARLEARRREGTDYAALVEAVRSGPPRLSLFSLPGVREALSLPEYYVHHEDVLRAGGRSRTRSARLEDALWERLRATGRLLLRRAPGGVRLVRASTREELRVRGGEPEVAVTGAAGELFLLAFGRLEHAAVRFDGPEAAVSALKEARLGP